MQHLLVVFNLATFGAGLVAATLAYQAYKQSRLAYIRHFFHYLLLLNVVVGIYLTASYVVANLDLDDDGKTAMGFSVLLLSLGIVVVAAWLYKLIAVMRGIREKKIAAWFRLVWIAGFSILTASLPLVRFLAPDPSVDETVFRLVYLLYLFMLLAAILVTLHTLAALCRTTDKRRRKAAIIFAVIHLVLFLLAPAVVALPAPLGLYAASCGLALSSLVPTIYLRRSVLGGRPPEAIQPDSDANMKLFAERYGVSLREMEIVSLVLGGKTNSEIGEILFISPNTVRNHIHNVYRKTGIRNRVELTHLILKEVTLDQLS